MDYVLAAIGAILVLAGIIGCIVPIVPGGPLAFAGLLLLSFTPHASFSVEYLIILGIAVTAVVLLDNFVPIFGSKVFGVSRQGVIASFIGMIVGLIFFPPFGAIPGIIIGAIAGEYMAGKKHWEAIKAGLITFALTLAMFMVRLSICGYIAYIYFRVCFEAIDFS